MSRLRESGKLVKVRGGTNNDLSTLSERSVIFFKLCANFNFLAILLLEDKQHSKFGVAITRHFHISFRFCFD